MLGLLFARSRRALSGSDLVGHQDGDPRSSCAHQRTSGASMSPCAQSKGNRIDFFFDFAKIVVITCLRLLMHIDVSIAYLNFFVYTT